jgi:hypothetical protein
MVYKFLNTIIDDLFAFVIKMPTLHRLSCFRDDGMYVCMYICVCMCMHVCMYVCMYVRSHLDFRVCDQDADTALIELLHRWWYVCMYIYACMHACMYVPYKTIHTSKISRRMLESCLCDTSPVCVTQVLFVWHKSCLCDTSPVCVTQVLFVWHKSCLCDTSPVCVTQVLCVWHKSCLCDTSPACVTKSQVLFVWQIP